MEHRWGERVALRLTVELSSGSSAPIIGQIENVSSSGAFVRTDRRGPPRGPVEVVLEANRSGGGPEARLPAYVVRVTDTGVGLEWCEFAPRAVRELMVHGKRSVSARARPRALSSTPHLPCGPNTAPPPRAQSVPAAAAIGANTLPVAASAATE